MKFVTISHPDIGTTQVPASAVPHHAAAGWSVVEDTPVVAPPAKSRSAKKTEAKATPDSADGSAS